MTISSIAVVVGEKFEPKKKREAAKEVALKT
jgi:hypothetical protein